MKAIDGFKIWKINDCDWVWGTNFSRAVQDYMNQCGEDLDTVLHEIDEIDSKKMEISGKDLLEMDFTEEGDPKTKRSFGVELKNRIKKGEDTGLFASTEF